MAQTTTIATLGPQVRLVVFKFLVKEDLVPELVPFVPTEEYSAVYGRSSHGEEVLSASDVWLAGLRTGLLNTRGRYVLTGARVVRLVPNANPKKPDKKDVRFTFCRRNAVEGTPHPNFVERYNDLVNFFVNLTQRTLWTVEVYLNPYFERDGSAAKNQKVLMLDYTGRKQAVNSDGTPVMVYEGGREKLTNGFSQGIGPKIPLLNKANELKLVRNKVQLVVP